MKYFLFVSHDLYMRTISMLIPYDLLPESKKKDIEYVKKYKLSIEDNYQIVHDYLYKCYNKVDSLIYYSQNYHIINYNDEVKYIYVYEQDKQWYKEINTNLCCKDRKIISNYLSLLDIKKYKDSDVEIVDSLLYIYM